MNNEIEQEVSKEQIYNKCVEILGILGEQQ